MARDVDSSALVEVQKQLGISGQAGQHTSFLEDDLQQTFDVTGAVRRGRADIGASGYYYGVLENIHAAAGEQSATIDPMNPGVANIFNGYPHPIPRDFDLWLMYTYVHRSAGAGTLTEGFFSVGGGVSRNQGWGLDSAGAAAAAGFIGVWGPRVVEADLMDTFNWNASAIHKIGMRWPRGGLTFSFVSTVGGAAATIRGTSIWGLFPVGLGQDIGI